MYYPILTLPVEITTKIFLDCLPVGLPSYDTKSCTPLKDPPLLLTGICWHWRIIALSTPQLWSHVRLEFLGKHGVQAGHIDSWWVAFLGRWLSRAQTQPLSMTISNLTHRDPDEALVGLLDSCRKQWQDVTLKLPFNLFSHFSTHEFLPVLQRLALDAHSIPPTPDISITAFQHAPALTHVRLDGWLRPCHFTLPWAQLTTLELASASPLDCAEALRCTPKLVTCILEILEAPGTSLAPRSVPPMHHLRSLTLTGTAHCYIFPYLALPALEELDLAGRSLNSSDLSSVQFLVSRSGCQLRRLRLYYISDALTAPALQLLGMLPSLENFELAATEAKTITSLFLRLGDASGFLPQLQTLSISHHKMSDSHLHAMFHVVTDGLVRRAKSSPEHVQLCSFALMMQHEETPPRFRIRQRWQELLEGGMGLSVKNRYERWI
ncbi:hypothetical protein B0H17DRAFT_39218 [Mycena rosella]|uniref:F-box domain-containing protein n=1 Tax=Mycena rosella TaxID=1033263 RepID=A0AAD7GRY0_MYCRO|nr:hypothetical protein B0H17DRAFT_39218 [Mycena rosella]